MGSCASAMSHAVHDHFHPEAQEKRAQKRNPPQTLPEQNKTAAKEEDDNVSHGSPRLPPPLPRTQFSLPSGEITSPAGHRRKSSQVSHVTSDEEDNLSSAEPSPRMPTRVVPESKKNPSIPSLNIFQMQEDDRIKSLEAKYKSGAQDRARKASQSSESSEEAFQPHQLEPESKHRPMLRRAQTEWYLQDEVKPLASSLKKSRDERWKESIGNERLVDRLSFLRDPRKEQENDLRQAARALRRKNNYSKRAHSTRELRLRDFGAGFEEDESDHEHPDKEDPLTRPLPEDFKFN